MRYAGEKKLNIWIVMALGILALYEILCKKILLEHPGEQL